MKIYNMKDYAVIFCSLFTGLFCTVTASNDDSFSQATRTSFVGIPRKEGQIKDEAKANVPCVVKDIYGNFGRLRQLENQRLRGWDHNLFGFRSRRETEKGLVETCANQSNTHCFQEEERRDLLVN
ncbi:MAG: hypothetical protein LBJ89_04795, partial [Holosporales bacterium]|nr:hypothetical protein [Holosporales bacterium]